jgi:uncharacterized membrane protein (DUF2068 family)
VADDRVGRGAERHRAPGLRVRPYSRIANSHIFINGNHYDIDHRQAWGWTVLILGALELLITYGIWTRQAWARWTGVVIAGIHAIVVLSDMQAYPWWSLALFSVDLLIIYGLVAHGGRSRTTAT